MASIAEIREKYPQYSDMSDAQLATAMYRKFYSDMPRAEFNKSIGLVEAAPPPKPKPKPAPTPARKADDFVSFAELGQDKVKPSVGYGNLDELRRASYRKTEPDKKPRYKSDLVGSTARASVRSAGPLVGGMAGAATGAALLAPSAPFTLGIGPLAGGLVGGLGGALLGGKAQQSVVDMLPEDAQSFIGQTEAQQIADAEAHPYAVFAGEAAPGFLFGRPTTKLGPTLAGGALGGTLEAGRELVYEGALDPTMIGEAALFGAAQSKATPLVKGILGAPDTQIESEIRRTRPPPGEGRRRQADVMALGEAPVPIDVLPESLVGKLGAGARKGSPNATTLFLKYADETAKKAPAVARRNTGKIAPDDARTGEEAAAQAAQEVLDAQASVRPDVPLGEASTAMAERLLAERAAEQKRGGDLFNAARAKGVATLERKAPEIDEDAGWAKVSPEEADEFSVGEGSWINRKTGEIKSAVDMADLQKTREPGPEIAAALRDSISDFALKPSEIEGTLRLLDDMDKLSAVDTSNLYGLRESLSGLERRYSGTADAGAAAVARRRLDDLIAEYDAQGRFTGDPEVVSANSAAIQNWKQFKQKFDDNTLLGKLSGVEWRGGRREPINDPQTAKKLILGALSESGDRVRDLQQLRDHFGADSPEWRSLRQEAVEQLVGPQKDNPNYVRKLADWQRANPKLGELLMGESGNAVLAEAGETIGTATQRQGAMETGADFLAQDPKDFAAGVTTMTKAAKRDAAVALRQRIRDALTTPQSSVDMLNKIANNDVAQANMLALLPAEEARGFIRDAGSILNRVRASKGPLSGSEGVNDAESLAVDVVRVGGAGGGHPIYRAMANTLIDLLKGKGSPEKVRKDAEQLAADMLDPAKTNATLEFVDKMYGENAAQRVLGVMRQGAAQRPDAITVIGRQPNAFQAGQDADKEESKPADVFIPGGEQPIVERMTDAELDALIGDEGGGVVGGASLGERNRNPGNLRATPWVRKLPGYVGEDEGSRHGKEPGFAIFEKPEFGAAAQEVLLRDRYLNRGFNTPSKVIERYNPSADPRNTPAVMRNYKAYIAKRLGIGVSDPIPPGRVGELAQAIREFETGNVVSD